MWLRRDPQSLGLGQWATAVAEAEWLQQQLVQHLAREVAMNVGKLFGGK